MTNRLFTRALVTAAAMVAALPAAVAQNDSSRLVAIGGSVTEIVYALGAEDRLIARDTTSVFPEAANNLPDVGYMRALSPEGVLSVDPTLIVTLEGSGPPEALEVLEKARIPMVVVPDRFDEEGLLQKISIIGDVLGMPEGAAALSKKVQARIDAAQKATSGIGERKKVLFVLSLQGGRILASGSGTAADGMIKIAGAQNAVTEYAGYKQLTDEAVIEAAPDVILAMDRSGDHAAKVDDLLAHPAIAATPAGRAHNIVRMDGSFLLGFGPRTGEAAYDLAKAVYGNLVVEQKEP